MSAVLTFAYGLWQFLSSPLGRIVTATALVALAYGVGDVRGYYHGVQHEKAKLASQISKAVTKGDSARAKALQDFDLLPDSDDASSVPNDGFERP